MFNIDCDTLVNIGTFIYIDEYSLFMLMAFLETYAKKMKFYRQERKEKRGNK
jgi:hypothetical protein